MTTADAYVGQVDVLGEVLAADVVRRTALVRVGERTRVRIAFAPEAEETVTQALRHRRATRLRIRGRGEFSPTGRLQRVTEVHELGLQHGEGVPSEGPPPAIEDILRALAAEVPQEEWDALPVDLIDNLDHYIYGTPRR
jgi:hypothetical protein